jgi:hypothetical protein
MVKTKNGYLFSDDAYINFILGENPDISFITKDGTEISFDDHKKCTKYRECIFSETAITLVLEVGPHFKTSCDINGPVTVENIINTIYNYYYDYISDNEYKNIQLRNNILPDNKDFILTTSVIKEQISRNKAVKNERETLKSFVLNDSCRIPKEEFIKMSKDELNSLTYRYELQTYHTMYNGLQQDPKKENVFYVYWINPKK